MDKWQAQDAFWNSFGIPAFDEQTYFTEGSDTYPRLTYESFGGIMGQVKTLSASLWYKSTSPAAIKQKADEILAYMQAHSTIVKINGGWLWLKIPEATPFAQPIQSGAEDKTIKRILLTLEAECLTNS